MRTVTVQAQNLKIGDVINGKRIRHEPFIHKSQKRGTNVHLFVSNHGKVEPLVFGGNSLVTITRPQYNFTTKSRVKKPKGKPVATPVVEPTVEAAVQRAESLAGVADHVCI